MASSIEEENDDQLVNGVYNNYPKDVFQKLSRWITDKARGNLPDVAPSRPPSSPHPKKMKIKHRRSNPFRRRNKRPLVSLTGRLKSHELTDVTTTRSSQLQASASLLSLQSVDGSNCFQLCVRNRRPLRVQQGGGCIEEVATQLESFSVAETASPVSPRPSVPAATSVPADHRNRISAHSQVDFAHYLIPDLVQIFSSPFYFGQIDRYEAERLLSNKPPGTFLLRNSAQEDYLFSVSFRRFERTLHARIEQLNHRFSFDSHDPQLYSSDTVLGLIKHYGNERNAMFFEPLLLTPIFRQNTFPLQDMTRSAICSSLRSYDDIDRLPIPFKLKEYLSVFHYKQPIRVRKLASISETDE